CDDIAFVEGIEPVHGPVMGRVWSPAYVQHACRNFAPTRGTRSYQGRQQESRKNDACGGSKLQWVLRNQAAKPGKGRFVALKQIAPEGAHVHHRGAPLDTCSICDERFSTLRKGSLHRLPLSQGFVERAREVGSCVICDVK